MNINELNAIKERALATMGPREAVHNLDKIEERTVLVCGGTGCTSGKSRVIFKEFKERVAKDGIADKVHVIMTGCFGLCALGPIVIVYPEGAFYSQVQPEYVDEIVDEHLLNNRVVTKYLYKETVTDEGVIKALNETQFYKKQHRVALRNCGVIDPENIEEYIARDGYQALYKVVTSMSQDDVVNVMLASGLRGRGGAGFPTGRKWMFAKASKAEKKYVLCNADEGDPGAFMDRSVLEGDPHAIIEAMAIAAYTIGSDQGYIYVRAEYPIAVQRLKIAIKQAKEYGVIGKNVFGTDFNFDIDVRLGAGAFVCGEETALMVSIEGNRGEPRPRPPFPAVKGLFGVPTILNNVETYANVAQIILKGSEWFASMGTEKSKGTKVFALGGKITNTGLVEVPMGTTLREIIEEIGGGIPNGKKFKAAQTGGPSGGCIPASKMDVQIDYDNLISIGSMMGSGGLIVMDEDNCMVDIAKFFLEFIVDESCGKCTPCRIGTKRLYELLTKVTNGTAELEDLDKMEELCKYIKENSLCGLGQTAPNPVLSTLQNFRDEYVAHVVEKRCPAGVCKNLLKFSIIPEKCKGCTACARKCPVGAISGNVREPHVIDQSKCIKCGACIATCKFGAVVKG